MRITVAKIGNNKTVNFAVEELCKYLKLIDSELMLDRRLYEEYSESVKGVIWVGGDKAFDKLLPEVDKRELDDAIYIDVDKSEGIITGTNPRSVLIAVYRFLKELGCAWVRDTSDGEIIPRYTLSPVSVYVCEKASYRHRGACIEGSDAYEHVFQLIDWLPKMGMNAFQKQFMIPGEFFDRWYDHLQNPYAEKESLTTEDIEAMVRSLEEEIDKRGLLYHAVGHGWTSGAIDIKSTGWAKNDVKFPEEKREFIALVNGVRDIHTDKPLCTNLCYSNPRVRQTMVDMVVDYCKKNPTVSYLHFWLSDGVNNFCECESCGDTRPSDWYVKILNEIDEALTENGIDTHVVFLAYVDLLWAPVEEKLKNPDRFTIMFAPIKRSYAQSFKEQCDREVKVPEFVKNKLEFPKDVAENVAHLRNWLEASGVQDGFDYDYHLMWNHTRDAGYFKTSKILFDDMQNLDKIGLNGMVSCQLMRGAFPSGLTMHMMAEALWDKTCDFEEKSDEYFLSAFGDDGLAVKAYTRRLSELLDPNDNEWEFAPVSAEQKKKLEEFIGVLNAFAPVVDKNIELCTDDNLRRSWEYLSYHKEIFERFAKALIRRADGADMAERERLADELVGFIAQNEMKYHRVFDVNNSVGYFKNSLIYYKGEEQK